MTAPSRPEAASLLLSLDPPAWHLRHSRAVAEVAAWIAVRVERRGGSIDRRLVEAAALLHDVDKLLPIGDSARSLPHGEGSAAWLTGRGFGELAEAVAGHPITRLAAEDGQSWLAGAATEARIVAYADKRAGQRLEPMAARFAGWSRRYPEGWPAATASRARARADQLERDVCALAGVAPENVQRLRWVDAALSRVAHQ